MSESIGQGLYVREYRSGAVGWKDVPWFTVGGQWLAVNRIGAVG